MRATRLLRGLRRRDSTTNKIKVQHSLLPGLKQKLQNLVLSPDGSAIKSIVPGTIAPVKNLGRESSSVFFRLTVPLTTSDTLTGWKAIVFAAGARQEVFISTLSEIERSAMINALLKCGLTPMDTFEDNKSATSKTSSSKGRRKSHLSAFLSRSLFVVLCYLVIMLDLTDAIQQQSWSNRRALTLSPIAVPSSSSSEVSGIWAAERPFVWNSIDVGGRSFIARIPDGIHKGGLLVHSPVDLTPELADEIKKIDGGIGVRVIIAPNYEHLKYSQQWAEAFPQAELWACPGLEERMPEVKWTKEMKTESVDDYLDLVWFNCEKNPFTGKAFFNEVVFYYRPLKALFCSDVFWNYPSTSLPNYSEEMTGSLEPKVDVPFGSRVWKFGMDKVYLPFYKRLMTLGMKDKFVAAKEKVLSFDIDLIVPCHGDVIRGKNLCKKVLTEHWR